MSMERRDMLGWAAMGGLLAALAIIAGTPGPARRPGIRPVETAGIDGPACLTALTKAGVEYDTLGDFKTTDGCRVRNVVRVTSLSDMGLASPFVANCHLALAVQGYAAHVIAPAARHHLGAPVERLHHLGTFACRRVRVSGGSAGPPSQHASALAIDINAFELSDGRRVNVLDGWPSLGARVALRADPTGAFLHTVAKLADRHFTTVLTPDFDRAHANHFHLGLSARRIFSRS